MWRPVQQRPALRHAAALLPGLREHRRAIATRAIIADLRAGADGITGGPAPFARADGSRFLQALDEALARLARG